MTLLRNIGFQIAFYGGSVLFVLAAVASSFVSRRVLRQVCTLWSDWHHWCCRNLLGLTIREEGQRPDIPVLYAIKHESFFEAIEMCHQFDMPAAFAKAELFAIPGWGIAGRRYGLIPVERDAGAKALRAMIRQAQPAVEEGRPLIIFPEGTRVPHGTQPPLQSGFAALYKLLGLPVVPVAVNSGPIYEVGLIRPGTITYRFGEMIPPGLPRREVEARVHEAINALNPA